MASSTTLTIRIDDDLKTELEEAARLDDRSVTEFVVRAIKTRMAPQCPRCGRSETPMVLPAGLSSAMDAFLEERRKQKYGDVGVVLTTLEGTQRYAYWGHIRNTRDDTHGVVLLEVDVPTLPAIPVPRGLITGWEYDQDGRRHGMLLALGYANGNALVEQVLAAINSRRQR